MRVQDLQRSLEIGATRGVFEGDGLFADLRSPALASLPEENGPTMTRRVGLSGESQAKASEQLQPESQPSSSLCAQFGERTSAPKAVVDHLVEQASALEAAPSQPGSSQDAPLELQTRRERALAGFGLSGCTTTLIRNIPRQFSQHEVMDDLNRRGFEGTFDFLYVPPDGRKHTNRGIAFVNFASAIIAEEFYCQHHGKHWDHSTPKPTLVAPADIQGLEHNSEHFAAPLPQPATKSGKAAVAAPTRPLFLRPAPQLSSASSSSSSCATSRCTNCKHMKRFNEFFCGVCGTAIL